MNKTQINKLRMFESVHLVLTNHSQIFSQLTDLVACQQRLNDGIQQIAQYRQVQEADNSGLTETKIDLRTNLISKVLQLSAALKAYAISINNKELKTKADYSKSDLMQAADPVLYDIGILLVNLATPLLTALTKYFITSEKLAEVSTLLVEFLAAIPQKRVANSVSKVSTLNIGEIFNSVTKMLKEEMDVLMLLFAENEPDFYNAYKNARLIMDYTGRGKTQTEKVWERCEAPFLFPQKGKDLGSDTRTVFNLKVLPLVCNEGDLFLRF